MSSLERLVADSIKNPNKEPVNLRIETELIEKVEDIIFNLRKQLPRDKCKKLTRSRFFELALEAVIKDYESSNEKSVIFMAVTSHNGLSL